MVSLGSLVTEIISSARPRFSKSLLVIVSALLAAAVLCWGCGEEAAGDPKILTVVRVEEKLPDGTWAPVSGADVYYEIYASRATDGVHIPIYQEYADTTDEWGLSAMLRDPDGKNPGDIGLVFIDVTHPGGRTLFRKWKIEQHFDFSAWFATFAGDESNPAYFIDRICNTVSGFPDCERTLERNNMITWGRGALMRLPADD